MEKEIKPRATKELAERYDYLQAKMSSLQNSTDELVLEECFKSSKENVDLSEMCSDLMDIMDSDEYFELGQELADLIENYDWMDEVFEENGKKGLKNVKGEIVVPAIYDDFLSVVAYGYKANCVAQLDGKAGLVKRDGKGTPVSDFDFEHVESIPFTPVHAVWKAGSEKFALMIGRELVTPFELEKFCGASDGVIVLEVGGKMGMLAYDPNFIYIAPEYDRIDYDGCGSCFTFVKDGIEGRVTYEGKFVSNEEFDSLSEDEKCDLEEIGFVYAADI